MDGSVPELVKIDAAEEQTLTVEVLRRLGAGEDEAADQARVLVEGDLRGRPSHGVQRLPVIAQRIQRGLIRPDAKHKATWTAEALLTVDGAHGFGPHIAMLPRGSAGARRAPASRPRRSAMPAIWGCLRCTSSDWRRPIWWRLRLRPARHSSTRGAAA